MKKRWKSLTAWLLILTMIGGYGNTALAAGIGDVTSSGTESGVRPEETSDTETDIGGGSGETGGDGVTEGEDPGNGEGSGGSGSEGESKPETPDDTTGEGETDGETGGASEEEAVEPEELPAEEPAEEEAAVLLQEKNTYKPYWENGNRSNLVVFVDFADTDHNAHPETYGECLTKNPATTFKYFNGDEDTPRGMRQYLYNISYGQLRVENIFPQYDAVNNTITPYTLSGKASDYVNNESGMVTEILEKLNASGQIQDNMNLHLSGESADGKYFLDNLNIVLGGDSANVFVNHQASYFGNKQVAGCLVQKYTITKEKEIYLGHDESGVIIHEFLHTLGYPDMYRKGEGVPIGTWDIMANVSYRLQYPLAYLRSAYTNWFQIPTVTESQTGLSLYAASKTTDETKDQQALILKTDYSDTEFFVVEYRKKADNYEGGQYFNGYEAGIPGSGLLVYRVNTSQSSNYTGTSDLVYLFRPGDSYGNDGRELGKGEPFSAHLSADVKRTGYGSSNFEDSLSEGAITYSDGANSGIVISNVGNTDGDQITFDITFHEKDESALWKTLAIEKEGEYTSASASCMDKEGNLYYILKKANGSYLYECKDGAFTRKSAVPAGSEHKLAWFNGQLYTAYLKGQYIKLARWNGSSWQELYTSPYQANEFSMTSDTKGVYLAYANQDGTRVYAASYTAAGAANLGSQVAASTNYAANASIAAENGTIVVMYREAFNNNRICVKQYNSAAKTWSDVGSQSFSANSGIVKIRGGKVYLMKNGSTFGENKSYLYVYDLRNGGNWQQVGSNLYADASIAEMDLCFAGGEPYVVFMSGSQSRVTEVKRLQDGVWTNLGESVARETVSGLAAYSFDGQIYVTYLNTVNNRAAVKGHASESTGVDEQLWELFPDALEYGTIEVENPFHQLVERFKDGTADSGLAAFGEKRYTDSFGSQIEDPLAKELYNIMAERYARGRMTGNQRADLTNQISFPAKVSGGSLIQDSNYTAAREKLVNCFNLAFGAFYLEYPSVFWMNRMGLSYGIGYNYSTKRAYITSIVFQPGEEYYEGASGQVASYDVAVKAAKGTIEERMAEAGLDSENRYHQVKAIHEYLCDKLTYDHEAGNDLYGKDYGYAHTSSTAFLGYNGEYKVVCEGYAKAFKVLCEQWDIPCILVIGQGGTPGSQGPHMWNYVQMEDGFWYGMDATWDDQELSTGARDEYFLAGSNTPGFVSNDGKRYTFIEEHVSDMQITTGAPHPFVYPELEQEKYEPGYRGSVREDADGKWLEISEIAAEKELSLTDIQSFLQKNRHQAPFDGISIVWSDGVGAENRRLGKRLEKEIINRAVYMLKTEGELEFVFREEAEQKQTSWHLVHPEYIPEERGSFNGTITTVKAPNGAWSLSFADSDFPAEQVWVSYSDSRLESTYYDIGEETRTVYYYRMAGREKTFVSLGEYAHIAANEEGIGELHTLLLYDINNLEAGVLYTAETSRYDWRLEYGFETEHTNKDETAAEGTVVYYTSQEEMIKALEGMTLSRDTNIRVYNVGKEQPKAIPAGLIKICSEKGLNLEYTRSEKRGLSYTWSFQGISIPAGEEAGDFDLQVDLRLEDAELPPEFMERTYIQAAPAGILPACEQAELQITQNGIGARFADGESLNLWLYEGEKLRYQRPAQRDQESGNWVSFTLNQPSKGQVYVLTSQSEYGWQTKVEDGKVFVYYVENRTGKPVTGWQIVEGRKCYFTREGYLCEGPTWVEADKAWYLFGNYQNRTQGILIGYQEYPQDASEGEAAVQGTFYYTNTNGVIQKGWQKINNIWHYFNPDEDLSRSVYGQELPSRQEGYWVIMEEGSGDMEGRRYYFRNNTTLLKNWQTIDKRRYFFTAEGYALTGWYPNAEDKNVYYLNELGQMETGYVVMETVNESGSEEEDRAPEAYFFNTNGLRQYGWQRILNEDGAYIWHYFNMDPASTAYSYGQEIPSENTRSFWYVMEGDTYYFTNNTRLATGWQTIEGKRYYFDSKGKMYTDTQKIGSAFYHFRTEEGQRGVLGTGLFEDGKKTYYANSSGVLQRGWQKIDGIWRFFNHETGAEEEGTIAVNYWAVVNGEDGAITKISYFINGTRIATGWQTIEGRRYYFDGNGILQTGFFKVGNNTYYGREEAELSKYPGEVLTGKQIINGAEYYFGTNYVMYVGWQKVDGVWCFFSMEDNSPERGQKQESLEPVVEASWYWYTVNGEKYCFRNNSSLLKGWQTINGQRYYLNPSTGAATVDTTLKIGSYVYCFDKDGVMQKNTIVDGYGYNGNGYRVSGWQKINNEWHYFAVTNMKDPDTWKEVSSKRDGYWVTLTYSEEREETYYFRNNASLVKGWQTIDGKRYYFEPKTGVLQTGNEEGLYTIGVNIYYLGDDGVLRYGWIREKGEEGPVYYANTAGVLLAGWQKIENQWYYFDRGSRQQDKEASVGRDYFATAHEGGELQTFYFVNGTTPAKGWQTIGGLRYYFDTTTNVMRTGFFQVGKAWYYFYADRTPGTGWMVLNGNTYYFNNSGQAVTGWQNISGSRYYFNADGVMQTQRTKIGNTYYFFGPDGKMRTGFVKYCDTTYYFNGSGVMLKGWQNISGQRYYFDTEGSMQTGFLKIGTAVYYFGESRANLGQMLKGEQRIGEHTYYLNNSGVLQYGWQKLNNEWRYFDPVDGAELETETDVTYWVTIHMPDGTTERSFINNRATVLKGWQTIAGKRYYFDAGGLLWTEAKGWLIIGNNRYYFNEKEDDSVYQGFLELTDGAGNRQTYYLNANGQMLKGWQTIKIGNVSGRYYLDPTTGEAWMGHQKIGNNWYYFDPSDQGKMAVGYIQDAAGNGYYYNTSGVRQYGWQRINNVWHYFMPQSGVECKVTIDEYYWAVIELGDGTRERAFIRNGSSILKGWQMINGQRYYFDSNGFQWREDKGWLVIGSNRFYFDEDKNNSIHQGFLELEEEGKGKQTYYLNNNGQALKGWQTIKVGTISGRYYLDPADGSIWMGHQKVGSYWYYFDPLDHGKMATGYVTDTEGDSYYYNTNGTLITGWQKLKGEENYRYFDAAGDGNGRLVGVERSLSKREEDVQTVVSGRTTNTYHWYTIDDSGCTVKGSRYCFLNNKTLLKNRQSIDGKYYWFHSSTGALYTGYFAIGQNRYYSNADGTVYTGFDPCIKGDPAAPDPSAANVNYYNVYGQRVTGWQTIPNVKNGPRYYFNANGVMLKGICWIGNTRYVFDPDNGQLVTDVQRPVVMKDGKTYYANANGTLKTGWNRFYEDGEYIWRCLSASTGEYLNTIKDLDPDKVGSPSMPNVDRYAWYHVTEGEEKGTYCVYNNSSVLKNYQNIGGKRYYFHTTSGKLQKGWFQAGANTCYSDPVTGVITGGFQKIGDNTYYLNTNGLPLKGWQRIYNSTAKIYSYYYFGPDGKMLTGFQKIGNTAYYLNDPDDGGLEELEEGVRVTGNVEIGGKKYYFNASGVMQTGWILCTEKDEAGKTVNIWRYYGTDGREHEYTRLGDLTPAGEKNAAYVWYEVEEAVFCIYNNKTILKNFYNIGSSNKYRYYFDATTGELQKGAFTVGTAKYYSDPETGVIERSGLFLTASDGELYYFDGNGRRVTGWLNLKEQEGEEIVTNRYYFDPANQGQAASGFTKIGNQYYYFDPDTRVLQKNASALIHAEDPEGGEVLYYTGRYEYLLSGWQKVQGIWYYFDPATKEGTAASAVTGGDGNWVTLGGNRYYFRYGTTLVKGWQTIKDEDGVSGRYYFDTTGALKTGWIEIGANRYYTDLQTGKAVTGFKTFVNGVCEDGVGLGDTYNSYYFDANGLMRKGWISETKKDSDTKSYYFNANGIMLKGICWIGNTRYVLHPDTGEKVTTSVVIDGVRYYANTNGTLKTGWQKVYNKEKKVYESFYYGTDGRLCTGWQEINKQHYYFDEKGVMLTGYHTNLPVPGSESDRETLTAAYYFNGSGIRQAGWFRFTENKVYVWRCFGADGQECMVQTIQDVSPEGESVRNYRWYQVDGNWYCIYNNASVLKGFYNLGTWRYYFDSVTGAVKKGHFAVGNISYYSKPDTGAICRSGYKLWTEVYEEKKLTYFDGNGKRASGWMNLKEGTITNRYYFDPSNGQAASGFTKVGSQYYYFDPETKVLQRNASAVIAGRNLKDQEVLYYTGRYEYLLSGWQKINGSWYYFDAVTKEGEKSEVMPGRDNYWVTLGNGNQYYFLKGTTLAKGWQNIVVDGVKGRYYFDSNGVMQKGWIVIGANRYYTEPETGRAVSGLKTFVNSVCEDGVRPGNTYYSYYFDGNGLMCKGQITVRTVENGKTVSRIYYFNADGIMLKGIFWIGNTRYVHNPDSGERVFDQVVIDGKTYYANTNGTLKTGLQRVYNSTKRVYESFYYGTDGQRHTGWQEINGQRYYFDPTDGVMKTGYQSELPIFGGSSDVGDSSTETDGAESAKTAGYYFNANGIMQTGWILSPEKDEAGKTVNVWRYFDIEGREHEYTRLGDLTPMGEKNTAYVWYEVEEAVFCIYNNKTVLKNFYNIGSLNKYRYYFDAKTGELQKGAFTVGTANYYSDPETGAIVRAGLFLKASDGELYYYDGNGKQVTGWLTIRSGEHAGKYYFHTLTGAAYRGGWYYIDNVQYLFDLEGKVREVPVISTVVANNFRSAVVTWKEVPGAKRYVLEYAKDTAFTEPQILSIEGSQQVSREIQGLQEGVRYYFRLKYELESKQTGEVEESVYSAVKNVVIQAEVNATGSSAVFQRFALAEIGTGDSENLSTEVGTGTEIGIRAEFTVKGRLKSYQGDGNYYLVRVDSYTNRVLSEPLYTMSKDDGVQEGDKFRFSFDIPLPKEYVEEDYLQAESMGGTKEEYLERQVVMSKYALAVKSNANGYTLISKGTYVSNPQTAAECHTPYFEASSKKGIQGATGVYSMDLGTKQTVMNLDLKSVLKSGPGGGNVTYHYKGKDYYFSNLLSERGTVTEYNNGKYGNGISVTMVILCSYRSDYRRELVHPSARHGGAAPYYTLNSSTQSGQELYEALFSYLGEIFGQDDCYVSNWVLGNEVNSCNAWNYKGSLSFNEYMKCYAASFRQLYYGVKTTRASSRVFISLDNAWNRAVAGFTGKAVLDTFASYIQAEGPDMEWNVAFHPYSAPLTRTDFWNDRSNTTDSVASPFISMRNLNQLTNYLGTVEKKYGRSSGSIRVILSEQGWTSSNCGEYTQAMAIARAYYIAEFNSRVDAFIIRAEIDDWDEMQAGLYMGLRNYGYDTKKMSYYVYKYMDTPRVSPRNDDGKLVSKELTAINDYTRDCLDVNDENKSKFMQAKEIICGTNWTSISGYNVEKLNGMPYAMIPDLKKLPD